MTRSYAAMLELHHARRSWTSGHILGLDDWGTLWIKSGEGVCQECGEKFANGWKTSRGKGACSSCVKVCDLHPTESVRMTIFANGWVP